MVPDEHFPEYTRPVSHLLDLFGGSDAAARARVGRTLEDARKLDLDSATIVIASWENRFAAAGGVRAVTQEYAKHLVSRGRQVRVVSPLHTGLVSPPPALPPATRVPLLFGRSVRSVQAFEVTWDGVLWVLLGCEDFFSAEGGRDRTNPYLYDMDDREESAGRGSPLLVRDCLLFSAAVPEVLRQLGLTDNLILHLQDWETVALALTMKEALLREYARPGTEPAIRRAVSVLALHNPYDKSLNPAAFPARGWQLLTSHPEPSFGPSTFLARMLPLLDAPPATVSREFAIDLVSDPLQTEHLADHLQGHFKFFGIDGVDNGPFENRTPPFTPGAIAEARNGRPHAILEQKRAFRRSMIASLVGYRPDPTWGNVDFAKLRDEVPVFMCVGRLDPGQKGFDVATRAIEVVIRRGIDARFILTPIVGNAPQPFVDDLERTAAAHPDHLIIYPVRMVRGYQEAQAGSTFSLWPSMYEPFGAVSEFLLRGTPVIARSTGGLRQQVVDFSMGDRATGAKATEGFPAGAATGNGILYTTMVPAPGFNEWREVQREPDPAARLRYPIYRDQVLQLANAIERAAGIFRDDQAYGLLLSNTYDSVAGYSWERAAREYSELYHIATQ